MEICHESLWKEFILASINCYTDSEWIDFAKMIEEAGADALEINILALQSEVQYTYGSFEQRHIDILRHIKKTIHLSWEIKNTGSITCTIPPLLLPADR